MTQEEIKVAIEEKQAQLDAKTAQADEAIKAENADLAKSLLDEAKAIQAEIDELNSQLNKEETEEFQEERSEEEISNFNATEATQIVDEVEDVKEVAEVVTDNKDIEELQARVDELEAEIKNINKNGETRSMTNIVETVELENKVNEVFEYRNFLMTGETRGVKTVDEGVLVPEEIATNIEKMIEDLDSLEKYVTVKPVNNLSGTYPVRNDGTAIQALPTVAELEESPELGLRKLGNQEYKIATHRGLIKASWEAIDDGVEVESIINEELAEAIVATKNKKILDALSTLEAKTVSDLDGLKTILNTGIAKRYAKQIVVSTDVYDALDKMKDAQGQYLLQPAVTSESGYKLFGKDVVVLDADVIGTGVMYVGSLKDACILFLRKELLVKYEIWNQYGRVFSPILRLDAKIKNPKAVVKVNFTAVPTV